MSNITIDEGLRYQKTLKTRHSELVSLRNENSKSSSRYFGDREVKIDEPVYDVKVLDKMVNAVAKEIRKLDEAIKSTNAATQITGYTKDESAFGELA